MISEDKNPEPSIKKLSIDYFYLQYHNEDDEEHTYGLEQTLFFQARTLSTWVYLLA